MVKPQTIDGCDGQHTADCERVLVTLLRGLGPWRDSVFLGRSRKSRLAHQPNSVNEDCCANAKAAMSSHGCPEA